jgi:hypothetical protein
MRAMQGYQCWERFETCGGETRETVEMEGKNVEKNDVGESLIAWKMR